MNHMITYNLTFNNEFQTDMMTSTATSSTDTFLHLQYQMLITIKSSLIPDGNNMHFENYKNTRVE